MADRIRTIGVGGDYADPILWAAGEGNINDGDRAVGVIINDISINALFRPNQSFPNGGLLRGNIAVTGEANTGMVFSNAATSRFCLSPSPNLDFEDFYVDNGGVAKSIGFQSISGSSITRVIQNQIYSSAFIFPLVDTVTVVRNSVFDIAFLNNSTTYGELDIENCLVTGRVVCRANNLLRFKNSISLASDWYLGRPTDSGAESLVNYSRIKQNANANEFGPGSSNNVVNYDSTNDLVNFAANDFRTRADSPLATAGDGGTFIGAFLQSGGGVGVVVDEVLSDSESTSLNPALSLSAPVNVLEGVSSSESSPLNPVISLTANVIIEEKESTTESASINPTPILSAPVIISEQTSSSNSVSINPDVVLSIPIVIDEQVSTTNSQAINPSISLIAEIVVDDSASNSDSQALDPIITIGSPVVVAESASGSNSSSLNPLISLTANIVVEESLSSTDSESSDPDITIGFPVIVRESVSESRSIPLNPTVLLTSAVTVNENTSTTNTVSLRPTIEVGQVLRIENINVSYKQNDIMVNYKANNITVTYGSN